MARKNWETDDSSPIVLFVLSLVILQVTADNILGPVFTLGTGLEDDGLSVGKRARKADYQAHPAGELVCRPFGLCEPCPVDEVSILWVSKQLPLAWSSSSSRL